MSTPAGAEPSVSAEQYALFAALRRSQPLPSDVVWALTDLLAQVAVTVHAAETGEFDEMSAASVRGWLDVLGRAQHKLMDDWTNRDQDMSDAKQTYIDQVAGILAKCDGFTDPLPPHTEQASRVFAYVVAPLLWLHAEAVWRLGMERLAHAVTSAELEEARADAVRRGFERDRARASAKRLHSAAAEAEQR